jgi:hypothetical protein
MNKPKPASSAPVCYRFLQRAHCAFTLPAPAHHDPEAGLAAAPTAPTLGAGFTEGQAA